MSRVLHPDRVVDERPSVPRVAVHPHHRDDRVRAGDGGLEVHSHGPSPGHMHGCVVAGPVLRLPDCGGRPVRGDDEDGPRVQRRVVLGVLVQPHLLPGVVGLLGRHRSADRHPGLGVVGRAAADDEGERGEKTGERTHGASEVGCFCCAQMAVWNHRGRTNIA
ncbi:hypothetical protein KBD61_04390 [Patescibacteria group bacterium]|nr:hypothetical protein [Patescibacteria group bacterium]MBP9710233.1 hypothetical protein [Patescibacteria group bacterium]